MCIEEEVEEISSMEIEQAHYFKRKFLKEILFLLRNK
jgi:hypothetical protein